jgi:hypothetical protein
MTEPPPEVVPREYWEIWYAACRLLEENAGLAILTGHSDFAKDSDNSDDECENTGYGAGA